MKKIVSFFLMLISAILVFSACNNSEPKIETTKMSNAEKIIGEWYIVGESEDTDSGEQLYEYYDSPGGSWIFNKDGSYTIAFAGLQNYNYTIDNDNYIKSYEKNGEYVGFDLKISWHGEDLVLAEYWREGNDKDGPYDKNKDHDFYILRRKK